MSPDASLKFWKRDLNTAEPRLFDWAEEFVGPGNVVWDGWGQCRIILFFAASLSGPEGHIVAVEEDSRQPELLVRSAAMLTNKCARVDVRPQWWSDSVGVGNRLPPGAEAQTISTALKEALKQAAYETQ